MSRPRLWHTSFTVSDLDAAIPFYELLGFEVSLRRMVAADLAPALSGYPDAVIEIAFLDLPGQPREPGSHDLELVRYHAPSVPGPALAAPAPGAAHLALIVDDIDDLCQRLVSSGTARLISSPILLTAGANAGGYLCYVRGPDGLIHELFQAPPPR